ncbi:arsenical pump-driving ATPase [Alkalicoccus urumqiensis]|uniref:Arsenical pump-driving ATPase n=1 Tax=Alkalicoccus urumqiensis TaxID=1548213 RepID=A0A2P6MI60_ALKUR|nr:arsenical pump-driving ATPase [Alkalicoccus urumqiensis]PRO65948.1 arsenical pump-driving ATPase [Alkalicoccus urumqiensis]
MEKFSPESIQTSYVFLTGKGGVGKTSTASASAVALARMGKKVLLVSTDPASNLQDVFDIPLTNSASPVPGVEGLSAANLDPEEAVRQYKERVMGPYRGLLPESALQSMEEQMSGACTMEIAAFDEFTQLLAGAEGEVYDHILFDTAPTGHTLRLLQLPQAWSTFIDENQHGASCLGPVSGLASKKAQYDQAVSVLQDARQTELLLITRPERGAVKEALRAGEELKEAGIRNQRLIFNGVFTASSSDPLAAEMEARQRESIQSVPADRKTSYIPLAPGNVTGIDALTQFFTPQEPEETGTVGKTADLPEIDTMIDGFLKKERGVIMTMGKGGVGKTTMAAQIAASLAEKGKQVHLTTTDPAAHIEDAAGTDLPDTLTVSRIDPKKETETYKNRVLEQAGRSLSEDEVAFMKEDLDSPCTEEIAVFQAFASVIAEAEEQFVVIDTAPTGHTLLLLDASESFHREMMTKNSSGGEAAASLLPRLRDPDYTSVVVVTLPEATPFYEAERLQQDLARAGITPSWWIINQALSAAPVTDPLLQARAAAENRWITKVTETAPAAVWKAWVPEPEIKKASVNN